jgi:hypothetical protein
MHSDFHRQVSQLAYGRFALQKTVKQQKLIIKKIFRILKFHLFRPVFGLLV